MSPAGSAGEGPLLYRTLDNPLAWELARLGLDVTLGLYRRRIALLRRWGVLQGEPSVLDVGCGIGQYAEVTGGEYLGLDLNCRYIEHARRRRGNRRRRFRCADIASLAEENRRFDMVLMVDILHHLDDATCDDLLRTSAALAQRHIVSFEPVAEHRTAVGKWINDHDRGDHIRPLRELEARFSRSPLRMVRNEDLMLGPIRLRAILAVPPGQPVYPQRALAAQAASRR